MTRARTLLLGAGLLLAATATLLWVSRPDETDPAVLATPRAPRGGGVVPLDAPIRPGDATGLVLPAAEMDARSSGAALEKPVDAEVAQFIEALRAADRGPEAAFHPEVSRLVDAFLAGTIDPDSRARRAEALVARLDDDVRSARVRAVLVGVLAAWGREDDAVERWVTGLETERLAIVVGSWASDEDVARGVVALDLADYVEHDARAGFMLLSLVARRIPGEPMRAILVDLASRFADDWDALLLRDAAILVLGTGIDVDEEVLPLLADILFDPYGAQADEAILYVLAHARGEAARSTLLRFLDDPLMPSHGKTFARWLMAGTPMLEGEFEVLVEPFREDDPIARTMAAGSLLKRLEGADDAERATIESVLAERVRLEEYDTARLAAIAVLARDLEGSRVKVQALSDCLKHDASTACRATAAEGLGSVAPALRTEALGELRAALAAETDPNVRDLIRSSIARLEQS
ncbi:MAG: hypothetical protein H6825_07875 [Planctomycetes bacterium]|nr:hypothetical protein [Planctomycetota bacterium]